jgi:hypothetical protein
MSGTVKEAWNMACPKCGDDDQIDICAHVWVRLCPDGTDITEAENGDHEWSDSSKAVCCACGHTANVRKFRTEGRDRE